MLTDAGLKQLALLDEAWNEMVEQIRLIRYGNSEEATESAAESADNTQNILP